MAGRVSVRFSCKDFTQGRASPCFKRYCFQHVSGVFLFQQISYESHVGCLFKQSVPLTLTKELAFCGWKTDHPGLRPGQRYMFQVLNLPLVAHLNSSLVGCYMIAMVLEPFSMAARCRLEVSYVCLMLLKGNPTETKLGTKFEGFHVF